MIYLGEGVRIVIKRQIEYHVHHYLHNKSMEQNMTYDEEDKYRSLHKLTTFIIT